MVIKKVTLQIVKLQIAALVQKVRYFVSLFYPALLQYFHHFIACFITEVKSTVMAFYILFNRIFVNLGSRLRFNRIWHNNLWPHVAMLFRCFSNTVFRIDIQVQIFCLLCAVYSHYLVTTLLMQID